MANKFIELRTKKQIVWHQRFHHLGTQNPHKLAKENLVDGFDCNSAKEQFFVSHVQRESIIKANFHQMVVNSQMNYWDWCTVMFVERLMHSH